MRRGFATGGLPMCFLHKFEAGLGYRGWEIPFPPLLHITNQRVKMPRLREDPWVGNPFPTLLHITNQRVKMPRLRGDPWVGNPFPTLPRLLYEEGWERDFPPMGPLVVGAS